MIKHPDLSLYTISTDKTLLDVNMIHDYLSKKSYWAESIPYETVKRSIENSMCFGVFYDGKQIGFARLITDKATFAYLADVFILSEHSGKGLSKWLMQTIQEHSELQGLRRWLLGTRDAHSLYEQFGWTVLTEEIRPRFMQRHFPGVYKSTGNK
jgi:GNAT superfamily N-acetyltransferase